MNKKFYGTLLLGTLLLGSTIVSCKDYDDDIDNLQNQITQLATKADMQSEVSKLQSAVATAQAAAENKATAAEQAAKDAAAKAQAAADAAAKAQGTADAAATVEALEKVAAEAAAAAKAAEEAKVAAEAKAEELASQLAELQALAATLVSTEDFEAAKKELNDKYAELAAKIGETTGTTGMTGLQVLTDEIKVGYGIWDGVHAGAKAAEWDGPKKDEAAKLAKGDYVSAFGANAIEIAVNPTDVDVTNTEFAVVNKYGEIAPIAFGAPEVLTRANAAGTYTVKVASAALTSDVVKEFGENFVAGTYSSLVAGKIASTLTQDFVAVTKNLNSSASAFGATVKYDEISGVVEVTANEPEKVYDSYITGLKGVAEHDSLLWGLKYDGMTLTYNADAAKKFAEKTFNVVVKQINLNGYIHETVAAVKFEAKNTTTEIEMEAVDAKLHTHKVQLNATSPTTGEDLQFIVLTKDEIIKALDLKKGTEDYIHFGHSTYTTATVGKSFAYSAENDKVEFAKAAASATVKDGNITLKFGAGYPVADFTLDKVDYVTAGATMYIPVTFDALDNTDLEGNVKTTYTINVPVKFEMPSIKDMYEWDDDLLDGTNANYIATDFKVKAAYAGKIAYYGQKTVKTVYKSDNVTVDYYTPNLTAVLDVDNVASYKALVKKIDDLVLGTTAGGEIITAFTTGDVLNIFAGGSITMDVKNTAKKTLKNLYMNKVYTTSSSDKCYYDTEKNWRMGGAYNGTDEIVMVAAAGITDEYSYTIKGLKAELLTLDNRVVALDDVKVTMNAVAAPTIAMTLTNNKLYVDPSAPYLQLSNAALAQDGTAVSFNGSFSIKDKYGYDLIITGVTTATINEVEPDGTPNTLTNGTEINIATLNYVIDSEATPVATADGLQIYAGTGISATATKIVVEIAGTELKRIYDGHSYPATDKVSFVLEIVR